MIYNNFIGIKGLLIIIVFIFLSCSVFTQDKDTLFLIEAEKNIWQKDNVWYQWKNFNNLFTLNDSLYCTYSNNVFESYLLVRRDSLHHYQWFNIYRSPFLKVLASKDSVEAWTSNGYTRTTDLLNWKTYPNENEDLSWSAVNWNNFSVWGLEERGRSGIIFVEDDSLIFEEIVKSIDVTSLGVDEEGNLYACLKNNKIYKRTSFNGWKEYFEFPNDGYEIRMIKFVNGKEYVGRTIGLYLNGEIIKQCFPSDIVFYKDIYLLSTYDQGIFISKDGITFLPWIKGLKNLNIRSITIFKDFIYAATSEGIYRCKINW